MSIDNALLEAWNDLLEKHNAELDASWFTTTEQDREKMRAFRHALPVSVNEFIARHKQRKVGTDMAVPDENFYDFLRFYKDTNSPEGGYAWLRKLDANVHEYTPDGTLLMQKLARREGLVTLWDMPDVRLFKEQKNLPVDYFVPVSGTPIIIDGIAIVRGAPNQEEAKRFYEFVTTPESLAYAAHKYYRIPVRTDLDRSQLPGWMNESFTRLPLDWELLRKNGSDWLRYWDTEIRGRNN